MPNNQAEKKDWVREAIEEAKTEAIQAPTERRALVDSLVADVMEGILVLRARDGLNLTTAQALERSRNIVGALIHNYDVRRLP
jgi:hypothetical protein